MKRFILIFTILLFSCNDLDLLTEQSSPLDSPYYILLGWEKFMEADYDQAEILFSTVLELDNEEKYADAYVGLGWTAMYKANTLIGPSNKSERENLRNNSGNYFHNADSLIDSGESKSDSTSFENYLSGHAYQYYYQLLSNSIPNYLDSTFTGDAELEELKENIITKTDTLKVYLTVDFFKYDSNVEIDDIYILRAQTYVRFGQFENAQAEIDKISPNPCPNSESVIECLDTISDL